MRFPAAILCGVAVAVLAAIPLAWLGGGLHGWIAWGSLLLGLAVGLVVFSASPKVPSRPPRTFWEWLMIVLFGLSSARAFFWLIYPDGDAWKILSPNNLGDLSLHLSLIRWLAAAPHWWPASPILAGDPLRYPPGSDLFNAVLLRVGVPVEQGLLWCGLAGAALAGVALWRWGGAVALAAFLFNGGCAGIVFLKTGWSGDPDAVTEWKNFFLTLFVTQRGFLYALPAGLLLLASWREEFFAERRARSLSLPVQALLLSVIPLFSIHAALFLGVMMGCLFLGVSRARGPLGRLAMIAWPVMALLGWMVTSGAGGPSALGTIGWKVGWMSDGTAGFWLWNFGISLPLAILLCLLLLRRSASHEARAFVWPAAMVFSACLLIRFAPWPWDNMKLMLWSWLVIASYLWNLLIAERPLAVRVISALLLFGSGAATLAAGLDGRHGYELVRRSPLDEAEWALRKVSPGDVIACAPEYNQPVLMLGHPVVCGYEGHLWSHGLDYKRRYDTLASVMKGEAGWEQSARDLGVAYVYWGESERKRWPDSKLPWAGEVIPCLHPVK